MHTDSAEVFQFKMKVATYCKALLFFIIILGLYLYSNNSEANKIYSTKNNQSVHVQLDKSHL
jgi:preprotein translocase subunit SecG